MKLLMVAVRVLVLTMLLGIFFVLGARLAGIEQALPPPNKSIQSAPGATATRAAPTPAAPEGFLAPFLLYCVSVSVVMAFLTAYSTWSGLRLMGALAFAMYGVMTVSSQVESLFFLRDKMPIALIWRLFLQGAITTALFVPCLVIIMGKLRSHDYAPAAPRPAAPISVWIGRVILTIVLFNFLYMYFGYYVAWRNPEVRHFYGGTDFSSLFEALKNNWQHSPGIYALQVLRSILFFSCVLPLVRMMRMPRWQTMIAMSAFLSVWTLILLLPNPIMPRSVALAHFWETSACYLIFGAILGCMLSAKKPSAALAKAAI